MIRFATLAAVLTVCSFPVFAQDPVTTGGLAGPAPIVVIDGQHRPGFTTYVQRENRPSVEYTQEVRVGTVLPEQGFVLYAVPATYGAQGYRYTIVNHRTLLVHPTTHQVVEIIN